MTDHSSPANADLLPCPFCGNQPSLKIMGDGVSIRCKTFFCPLEDIEIPDDTLDEAKKRWNKRTVIRAQPAASPVNAGWTPDQFWEYVAGLAGEFEAGQMRDMMVSQGLSLGIRAQQMPEPLSKLEGEAWQRGFQHGRTELSKEDAELIIEALNMAAGRKESQAAFVKHGRHHDEKAKRMRELRAVVVSFTSPGCKS